MRVGNIIINADEGSIHFVNEEGEISEIGLLNVTNFIRHSLEASNTSDFSVERKLAIEHLIKAADWINRAG